MRRAGEIAKLVKLGIAGLFFILLGAGLVLIPDFRANPKKFSLEDLKIGIIPFLLGIALLSLVVWILIKDLRSRPTPPKEEKLPFPSGREQQS